MTTPYKHPGASGTPSEEEIEAYYHSALKREKRKRILIFSLLIALALGAMFFSNLAALIPKFREKFSPTGSQLARQAPSKIAGEERDRLMASARMALDENRPTAALSPLLILLEKDPTCPEAHDLAGNAYLMRNDLSNAQAHYKRAIELKADDLEAYKKLGEIHLLTGDIESAQKAAQVLQENPRTQKDGLLLASEVYLAKKNLPDAIRTAQAAVDMSSGSKPHAKSIVYLAQLHLKNGNRTKAFEMIAGIPPGSMDADLMIRLAKFYQHSGDEAKAKNLLDQAVDRYPQNPEVRYTYGQFLSSRKAFSEAVVHFLEALRLEPDTPIIAYDLGQALLFAGKLDEAKRVIDGLLSKEPKNLLALQLKSQHEQMSGDRTAAIITLKQVIELAPDSPRPHLLLASLYWQEGLLFLAQQSALKTLALDANAHTAHLILGDVLFKRGQIEAAKDHLEALLAVQPQNFGALILIGDIYLRLNQADKAKAAYRRAMALNPQATFLKTKLAVADPAGGDRSAALAVAQENLKTNPENPEAVRTYLDLLAKNGKLDDAVSLAGQWIKQKPEDGQLHFTLADLLILKGRPEDAVSHFKKALGQNPQDVNLVLNIGARLELNKLYDVAENIYRGLLDRLPGNILVSNQLAWLYIEEMNAPNKADDLIYFLKTVDAEPGIKDTIGWYYFKKGDLMNAEHHLRDALVLEPKSEVVLGHLARTLLAQKNDTALKEAAEIIQGLPEGILRSELEQKLPKRP